jgi:hypothetical protein
MAEQVGGLIVRRGGRLHFIPSSVARRVVARPAVSRVPGTELGLSLIQGRVMAVLALGRPGVTETSTHAELVVCDLTTDCVAVSGLEVVASGLYPSAVQGVTVEGRLVPELDIAREVQRFEADLLLRRAQRRKEQT